VVSFTPRSLYRRYPQERRLVGPQSRSGRSDKMGKKNPCPHQESKPGKKKERKNELNEGGWTRGRRKREDKVRARREEKENEMQAVNKRKRMETITWKSPGLDGNQDLLCASCKDRSPLADATRCCSCSKTKESAWPCCGEV